MQAGKPFPVAMAFGQHPLLYIAASQAVPFEVNEYDWAGGLAGQPIDVIKGPLTGLHFPANAEFAIEGEIVPGESLPEGPFGEWPGYYASARRAEPFVRVKALYHRNDPIICGAAPFKPTIRNDVTAAFGAIATEGKNGAAAGAAPKSNVPARHTVTSPLRAGEFTAAVTAAASRSGLFCPVTVTSQSTP